MSVRDLFEQNFQNDWEQLKEDVRFLRKNAVLRKDIVSNRRFWIGISVPAIVSIIAIIRSFIL